MALARLSSKVPCLGQFAAQLNAPTARSLNAVRCELWSNRAEFWIRRAKNVPEAFKAAKGEACDFYTNKLTNTASWTYGDAASALVVGTQLFGCFCIGEILQRGQITGYKQGSSHGHH